ncbi:MAG: hypothetical protein AB7O24_28885 [Kofleriaceae bacterium]
MGSIAACTSEDPGEAPEISGLTYAPDTMAVGEQTILDGSVAFHDPEGDLAEIALLWHLPSGGEQLFPNGPVQGPAIDHADGALQFALSMIAPEAGAYSFELWVIDEAGNESNRLTGGLTAQ